MIIKKIAAICKSRKSVALFDDKEAEIQWISDGCAVYPLYDMPPLDEETVLVVLDVPGDKRGDYRVKHEALPAVYNFRDEDDLERMLPEMDVGIVFKDSKLMPARTSRGLRFFNPKYLEPLNDLDGFELYERQTKDGEIYFAVKTGFILQAILLPALPEPDVLADRLRMLASEMETTLHYKTLEEEEAEDDAQIRIDAETGEVIE